MAAYNAAFLYDDPVVIEINHKFDQMIHCLNLRRKAVLTAYRDLKLEIASRPLARARKEENLVGFRNNMENLIHMNEFREQFISDINIELEEISTHLPEKRVVFRSQSVPLEQLIENWEKSLRRKRQSYPTTKP